MAAIFMYEERLSTRLRRTSSCERGFRKKLYPHAAARVSDQRSGVLTMRESSESTMGARFNESEIALIVIERALADQLVPAPVHGDSALW